MWICGTSGIRNPTPRPHAGHEYAAYIINAIHVGELPPQLAALVQQSVNVEEMAVEAALTGNPELVYHATIYDPLSAAVLSLAEIKKMVQEMLLKNRHHLPQFKSLKI